MAERILIVDDEKLMRWTLGEALTGWGFTAIEAGTAKQALDSFEIESPAVTLLDINLPDGAGLDVLQEIRRRDADAIVIMIIADGLVDGATAALRAGAYDFIGKPINLEEIRITIRNAMETKELRKEIDFINHKHLDAFSFDRIIGDSPSMAGVKALARKVAASEVSGALLQGEPGTGKNLVAQTIHYSSSRTRKPFIALNCAAIPSTLIESELFGYEKGSLTDEEVHREGFFEQAEGGTIFLDGIGELEPSLQAKLLRVLEEGSFRRIGGLKDIPLDVRVIAASNRDLKSDSESGTFRYDLYYRLSVIQIDVPPLRTRGNDVLLLADHFIRSLDRTSRGPAKKLTKEAEKAFRDYHWTGNVRELRNAIERALILEEGDEITLKYMPREISSEGPSSMSAPDSKADRCVSLPPEGVSLEDVEMALIKQALSRSGGNITKAGELLHISRDRVRYRLKKGSASGNN